MRTPISDREIEILHLLAWEYSSKEIASQLYISEHTVISHRRNLMQKLDVKNTAGLIRKGFERGLLQISRRVAILILMVSATSIYAQQELELRSDGIIPPHIQPMNVIDPIAGMMIYDTTRGLSFFDGGTWRGLTSPFQISVDAVETSPLSENKDFIFGRSQNGPGYQSFFFFDKGKSAFRGGDFPDNTFWSVDSLGSSSLAWGEGVKATDFTSIALGYYSSATGSSSFAAGQENTASEDATVALGYGARALANYAVAIGDAPLASGSSSIAIGKETNASGDNGATALGRRTVASGNNGATAMGQESIASGNDGATALGYNSVANGHIGAIALGSSSIASGREGAVAIGASAESKGDNGAVALGLWTIATGNSSTAVGMFNDTLVSTGRAVSGKSPIFIVGNGDNNNTRSNALVVRKNGSIEGDGQHILYGAPEPPNDPSEFLYNDTVFYYDNLRGALKVGRYIGAPGVYTPQELGAASLAVGDRVNANGDFSVAFGQLNSVEGHVSLTSGFSNHISSPYSIALGYRLIANVPHSTVVGTYNDTTSNPGTINPNANDPIFIVGNGDSNNRSNAVVVRKNGRIQLGGNTVPLSNGVYDIGSNNNRWNTIYATNGTIMTSDRRAKKNIQKLEYGLDEILQLKPVIYHWKEAEATDSKKVGLIAQDVSSIIPEVVHTPENKEALMGINYAELVPVLINAIQEQQKQIELQNKEIKLLKKAIHQP